VRTLASITMNPTAPSISCHYRGCPRKAEWIVRIITLVQATPRETTNNLDMLCNEHALELVTAVADDVTDPTDGGARGPQG
jgi:hypothetical protein